MSKSAVKIPIAPNFGISPAQKERDYVGASFVKICRKCGHAFFGPRYQFTCRKDTEEVA